MVVAVGMHRDVDRVPRKVTAASESRRRTFAASYCIDKILATFTGRPPLLQARYKSTPLPLDLTDEALLAGGDTLAAAVSSLDENGWSKSGNILSATRLRARTLLSLVREDILDIALCAPVHDAASRIEETRRRAVQVFSQLQEVFTYHMSDVKNDEVPGETLFPKILVRSEHLQNLFLLARLAVRNKQMPSQELLDLSREILVLTMVILRYKDKFLSKYADLEWMLSYYAFPASGVLCVKLLKGDTSGAGPRLTFPRSEVIQNLSMFAEFLDWIKPTAPNANLCYRVRDIIRNVLDRVLNDSPAIEPTQANHPGGAIPLDQPGPEILEDYCLDVLDTLDWDKLMESCWGLEDSMVPGIN